MFTVHCALFTETMLKRNPSLVEQVKTHLKQRIINAEFKDGRIPSETDLANQLSVSRNTIRDALGRLEIEGVIFRKQGVGTFVNQSLLLVKTRLEEIIPYETMIKENGYQPSIELVAVDQESEPDTTLVSALNLTHKETVLVVQKLFKADDKPIIFTQTYIPVTLIQNPYTNDDLLTPIYQFLPTFCGQELAYYLSEMIPLIAPAHLSARLDLPSQKTALLSFEELGYNQHNQPIIKACSYFRDDLLRLRLIRRHSR